MQEIYEKIKNIIDDLIKEYNKDVSSGFFNSKSINFNDILEMYNNYIKEEFKNYYDFRDKVKKEYNISNIEALEHISSRDYVVEKYDLEFNMDDDKVNISYVMKYNNFEECFDINNRDLGEFEIISIESNNDELKNSSMIKEMLEEYINCFNKCQNFQINSDNFFVTIGLDRQDDFERTNHATNGNIFIGFKYKETRSKTWFLDYDFYNDITYVSLFASGKEGYFEGPGVITDNYVYKHICKNLLVEKKNLPKFLNNSKKYIKIRDEEKEIQKEDDFEDFEINLSEEGKVLYSLLKGALEEVINGDDVEKVYYRLMANGVKNKITTVKRLNEILSFDKDDKEV